MVSVLLTCYNHLRFLPSALDGVLSQTYSDYEILALDDGSTDGSRDWLKDREAEGKLRCIFNAENLGTYATLNVGLQHARGEYIAVLNDDDVWLPDKLSLQVQALDANPQVALVHTGGKFIDGQGRTTPGNPLGFAFPTFESGDILLGLVYENKIIASAALARKSVLDDLGGFNPNYFGSGDWEMWFRVAEKHHVAFIDQELTHYRVHGANASHKLERIWRDDQKLREWMAPRLQNLEGRFLAPDIARAQAFNYAALATVQKLNGSPRAARTSLRQSLRLAPGRLKSYARYLATYLPNSLYRRLL